LLYSRLAGALYTCHIGSGSPLPLRFKKRREIEQGELLISIKAVIFIIFQSNSPIMELDLDGEHAELEKKRARTFCAKERMKKGDGKKYNSNHAHEPAGA
jgi:hypothetical protein